MEVTLANAVGLCMAWTHGAQHAREYSVRVYTVRVDSSRLPCAAVP